MGKRISGELREFAELLYMQGTPQNLIAEKVGVSKNTVGAWAAAGCWGEKKVAQSLTRKQVVNNVLRSINTAAENLAKTSDPAAVGGIGDQFAKFAATIKTLDKEVSVVDYMECFMTFGRWLEQRSEYDPAITAEFCKAVNDLQDKFVIEQLNIGKSTK